MTKHTNQAVNSLFVVGLLLFILACKCSDNINTNTAEGDNSSISNTGKIPGDNTSDTENLPADPGSMTDTDLPNNPDPSTADAPSGGLWQGNFSNGYKGQTISFRVSADGKTISDVTFKGYLQCRGSRIEDTQLAPLRNVAISGDSFNDTQLNGGAKVRFDFSGTFRSAATAEGNYRVMSDTDCDTYKLNWTATRVAN